MGEKAPLSDLLVQNRVVLSLGSTERGLPKVTVQFPSFELVPPKNVVCPGCGKQAETYLETDLVPFRRGGFAVEFLNLRCLRVPECRLALMDPQERASFDEKNERLYRDLMGYPATVLSDEDRERLLKETELFDLCVNRKRAEGLDQGRIQSDILQLFGSRFSLGNSLEGQHTFIPELDRRLLELISTLNPASSITEGKEEKV